MSDVKTKIGSENIDLTLLANFTHQVINPLNGVAGTLDNILDGTIGDDRRPQRTRAARAQLENVITLVRNLAYLSSENYNTALGDKRQMVLPQVIIEAAQFYQEEGKSKKISIDLEDKHQQNKVFGHPETLKQILMNIFDNGIKYSKIGSSIEVHQRVKNRTGEGIITIRSVPRETISQGDIENMFELGFRGENAKQIIASGTGLGLHICRYLLESRHGGSISAQSDKDGLLFTIKLPNLQGA